MFRTLALLFVLLHPVLAAAKPVRVILVGDSTMASRTGYGDVLCERFRPDTTCINVARGGRSSGSFRKEGRWDQVLGMLKSPGPFGATYVLIQFGHNDQPGKPGRSTDLVTEFPANMARYVTEARALGAVPVLVTPLTRRSFNGAWVKDDLAPWSAATRDVARRHKVALIDLNRLSAAAVQAMGSQEADTLAQEGAFDHTHLGLKGAGVFSGIVASEMKRLFQVAVDGDVPYQVAARQEAPADGWGAGTQGGARASEHVYVVTNPAELRDAVAKDAGQPKIIRVAGIIDMRGEQPFASTADQDARGTIRINSNTTLVGLGAHAGFVNANLQVVNAEQVIIRNLHFQNPCDVGPVWDPNDGSKGNWNSQFDSIVVSASHHVWIDHSSFTDAPRTDDQFPIENGLRKQCHDGALDINRGSDFVTVSYNHFALHAKNILIGSSDRAVDDDGHLRVTLNNNYFDNVAERAPRVRFGRVHLFNNYHAGDRKHAIYRHHYSIGVGKQANIISHNNAFDVAGAKNCESIVNHFDAAAFYEDSGSVMNGAPMAACALARPAQWTVPYPYALKPAQAVAAHVTANAGAGKPLTLANAVVALSPVAQAPRDTLLRITFERPPRLGSTGAVRIFRQADGTLVDTITAGSQVVAIGHAGLDARRYVNHAPIRVRGMDVVIQSGKLAYGESYFVTVDPALLGKVGRWAFRTAPAPKSFTVDDDGEASFRTLQGAIDHVVANVGKADPVTIDVRNGQYEELLFIRNKDNLTIRGESRDGVVIHATNNDGLNGGSGSSQPDGTAAPTGGRALLLIEASDLLTLDTLTLRNDTLRATSKGSQAETLHFNNPAGRMVARNASFFSEQDTIQVKGYSWFYRTLIAGNVDFIWGANRAALFEESEIRTVADTSMRNPGGWLVQARTVSAGDKGFVFLNSRLTHGPGVAQGSTLLARSGGKPAMWDNVAFINCSMDQHIAPEGWARQPAPNPGLGWREFGNRDWEGKPISRAAHLLTEEEVARHFGSRAAILGDWAPSL